MLFSIWGNICPWPRTPGPNVHNYFHCTGVIERTDLNYHHLGSFFPLAVYWRSAVGTERAVELIAAIRGICIDLRLPGRNGKAHRRHEGVVAHP